MQKINQQNLGTIKSSIYARNYRIFVSDESTVCNHLAFPTYVLKL
jgi:hypothetical protein